MVKYQGKIRVFVLRISDGNLKHLQISYRGLDVNIVSQVFEAVVDLNNFRCKRDLNINFINFVIFKVLDVKDFCQFSALCTDT